MEGAIDDLPERFRMVFVMREIEELSVEETADFLGMLQATVKTRLHRARRLLRQNLDEQLAPALADAFRFDGMCLRANGRQGLGATRTFITVSRLTGSRDY